MRLSPGREWLYDKTPSLNSRKKVLGDTIRWISETLMTFTDRVRHVNYVNDAICFVNRPEWGLYKATNKNSDEKNEV